VPYTSYPPNPTNRQNEPVMGRGIGFLIVGLAAGFVLGTLVSRVEAEKKEHEAEDLADDLATRLAQLEATGSK